MRHILALVLLTACGQPPAPERIPGTFPTQGEVVMTANGLPITREVVDMVLERLPEAQIEMLKSNGQFKSQLEKMAMGEVLYHRALEQGLAKDPKIQLHMAMAERDALAQAVVDQVAEAAVTDAKLAEAYEARKVQYAKQSADVRIILLDDEEKARGAHARIAGGEDFGAVAKELSLERTSAEKGGEFGWVVKGQLAGPVDEAVFGVDTVGLLEPMMAQGRWFILDVRSRRDLTPLEEVKDQLAMQIKQEAVQAFVGEVEKETAIEWKMEPETLLDGSTK